MYKKLIALVAVLIFVNSMNANSKWCDSSGELLENYPQTIFYAQLSDMTEKKYCCIHHLAKDYDAIKDRLVFLYATDYESKKQIDAQTAFYLVNSKIKSKWSLFSKVAFETKEKALEYKSQYGGNIRDFSFTLYLASHDIANDVKSYEKRIQMGYKRGKNIYEKVCNTIDPQKFYSLVHLKTSIIEKKLCKEMKEENLQALSLYLWDIKREGELNLFTNKIEVSKDHKCPVCGMFVYKYPKWVSKISMDDKKEFYFDGVKDMMKFYFEAEEYSDKYTQKNFENIEVTDYYTLKSLDAKKAWYVQGSTIYGPMGHELIPFDTKENAQAFASDYSGNQILSFKDITYQIIYDLDH